MERALDWGSRSQTPMGSIQNLCMCRRVCRYGQHTHGHTQRHRYTQAETDADTRGHRHVFPPDTHTPLPHAHTLTHSRDTQMCSFGRSQRQGKVSPQGSGGGGAVSVIPIPHAPPNSPLEGEDEEGGVGGNPHPLRSQEWILLPALMTPLP